MDGWEAVGRGQTGGALNAGGLPGGDWMERQDGRPGAEYAAGGMVVVIAGVVIMSGRAVVVIGRVVVVSGRVLVVSERAVVVMGRVVVMSSTAVAEHAARRR